MEATNLILNGQIKRKDGSYFSGDKFFEMLEDLGFDYTGTYSELSNSQMIEDIYKIANSLSYKNLIAMKVTHDVHYKDGSSDIIEFLLYDTGTIIYENVITSGLQGEELALYRKYIGMNWEISDEFESKLSDLIVLKMQEFKIVQ